jgi:uncharacterized protein (DUF697 family)
MQTSGCSWQLLFVLLRLASGVAETTTTDGEEQTCLEQDYDSILLALMHVSPYAKGSPADERLKTLTDSSDLGGYCTTLRAALRASETDPEVAWVFPEAVKRIVAGSNSPETDGLDEASPNAPEQCSEDETWWGYFNPMASNEKHARANRIIHGAATVAAGLGGALAQVPGASSAPITVVQLAMVQQVAETYGCQVTRAMVMGYCIKQTASLVGVKLATEAIGVVPFAGNAIKSTIAFTMTESIGFAAKRLLKCSNHDSFLKAAEEGQASDTYKALDKLIDPEKLDCVTVAISNADLSGVRACFQQK